MDRLCPMCGKITEKVGPNIVGCLECGIEFGDGYETHADRLAKRVAELESRIDLMIDEFKRIKSCPGVTSEIVGLCERAVLETMQHVPVIVQRDTLIKEKAFLHHANMDFREKNEALAARVKELEENNQTLTADNSALAKIVFKNGELAAENAALKAKLNEIFSGRQWLLEQIRKGVIK